MKRAAPSSLLAGAEACRVMLASIEALSNLDIRPASESDADVKAAYAGQYADLDKAVSLALDQHGDSAGFRAALGSYLLTVAGGNIPATEAGAAEGLLTDGGFRAMPSEPDEDADDTASVDFEDDGFRLESLLWLAEWIENARDLSGKLSTAIGYNDGLRKALESHEIPWGSGQWSDEASAGLNIITGTAIRLARGMKAKGMALERQQKGDRRHG